MNRTHTDSQPRTDFEALFHQAPAGFLITETDGTILEVNDTFLTWTGLERVAVQGANLLALFPADDRIIYDAYARPLLGSGRSFSELAVSIVGHDGHRHPALLSATRSPSAKDEPAVDRIIVFGISQRRGYEHELETALRRAEEAENARELAEADTAAHRNSLAESENELCLALRQSRRNESLLRTVLNTVDIGIAVVDHEANPVMHNSRYQRDLEHATPTGAGGGTDSGLLVYGPDHTTVGFQDIPLLRAARGESFSDALIWIGPRGDQRALNVSAQPVPEHGDFTGSVITYSDVTQLINAVAAKDDFLANVSHELRTPMTSIVGYLDLVLDDPDLPGHIAAPLKVALRNSERLLQLVGDLLSTATAGSALAPRNVDLAGLIRESICSATLRAQGNNVTITTDIPPTLPALLDPLRISQVLDNLLSNAIKFSPDGGHVTITAIRTHGHLTVEFTDTGIGMTPQDLQEAFTKFFRSDTVRKAAIPGAGLGLPITKNIIEAHHGTIALASDPGRGTTVSIILPFAE
ncbi:PAS domain-containing sensor histidine kinase [Paeniglutamicibacter terrestris]|uniref:histidine kinase n=1 Tax=Paeniglutamicibacter terrestris TaxID=2723403 RepID=A0ABX1G8K8_9MICC|nr:ATP-binding protein [Paeniglutamicibacter terrestris]NKG22593.1 PAS domain S-box protein [Paeniglutamicibacter terrestris]